MTDICYTDTLLLIDGQWCESSNGQTLDVLNPATGMRIGKVAFANTSDLERAVKSAERGFQEWRWLPAYERSIIMRKAAALMRDRVERIAQLLTLEQGKPLQEARLEVLAGASIIEWFADEGLRVYGRIVPSRNVAAQQLVIKEPVGPVAAFTPWNFPINQIVRKLGAALASGCSFLVKAPEETPASPAALMQTFLDAGVPPGTVGMVFGNPAEISSYLIPHPLIRKVTFTGSTVVGKQLAAMAGEHMKRSTMELGGHAPVIVADDADIDLAVKAAGSGKFRNAGQVCISPTRFLVHNSIKDKFIEGLVQYAESLKLGNGLNNDTTMGPLISARRVTAVTGMIEDACNKGAKVLTGGYQVGDVGNFIAPTVLLDVPLNADILNNEPFGPVAAVQGFNSVDEAIAEANRLPYGLAAYAYTQSLKNFHLLSQKVETGMLWINQAAITSPELPFGGIKDSGYGTEGGPEAMDSYLNIKTVSVVAM